jgi:nitrate reductase NapE component
MVLIVAYLLGCLIATATTALVARSKRASHEMSREEVALLAVVAGAVWPLLAVAGVQAVGLLGLAKSLHLMKSIAGHDQKQPTADTAVTLASHAAA